MAIPRISVITACYNSAGTIREALQSVVSQAYPALDLIVIDGGSTDGTLQIIEEFKDNISVLVSESDKGISDAFNKGIANASGDLIGILNSDDVMLPGALDAIAQAYDEHTDVYRGNMLLWNDKTGQRVREHPSLHFPKVPLIIHVCHGGTFVTHRAYTEHGTYDTRMKFVMDLDLLTRYSRAGLTFKTVDADIEAFRIGGVTNTPLSAKKEELRYFIKKNGGTYFHFLLYYGGLRLQDMVKRVLDLFDEDFKRKIRYRK
ncbi:MAG: glycosyltransferase [Bacteroidaceae bacterium]|nr:glycosyltransferase [Bacteroidaceae bacterium]